MAEVAVRSAADAAGVTMENTGEIDPMVMWAMAWQVRSAAWILRHARVLRNALA